MGVRAQTEASFQAAVIAYARLQGWRVYHTRDSRRSASGFPDLLFVRRRAPAGVLFAELKGPRGHTSPAQDDWLDDLRAAGARAYLWRPSDWPEIERVLGGTDA